MIDVSAGALRESRARAVARSSPSWAVGRTPIGGPLARSPRASGVDLTLNTAAAAVDALKFVVYITCQALNRASRIRFEQGRSHTHTHTHTHTRATHVDAGVDAYECVSARSFHVFFQHHRAASVALIDAGL
jgi:hypothetical protein